MKPNFEQKEVFRVEELKERIKAIKRELDMILGEKKWAIGENGEIFHQFSDLELVNLGKNVPEILKAREEELKKIYAELRETQKSGNS
jgi:ribosomal protein L29